MESDGSGRRLERQQNLFTQTADCPLNLTSTISSPNVGKVIAAIAAILHSQIETDSARPLSTNPDLRIFDEAFYLETGEGEGTDEAKRPQCPTSGEIGAFMYVLYEAAQYSVECHILALLYVNRLIAFSGLTLHGGNWRPVLFTALLIAQKVWDDRLLSNRAFTDIYPFFSGAEMNKLEAAFLNFLQFEVVVKPSTYAKYYFELRAVQDTPELPIPSLSATAADDLEERTRRFQQSSYLRFCDTKAMTMM